MPDRHYHTLDHLTFCFKELDNCTYKIPNQDLLELSLWLHDLIYIPSFKYNESLSAAAAYTLVMDLTKCHNTAKTVRNNILYKNSSETAKFLFDIDIAILGQNERVFTKYEEDIRQEYSFLPEPEYLQQRKTVLKNFLDSYPLYLTAYFQCKYEKKARRNLKIIIEMIDKRLN